MPSRRLPTTSYRALRAALRARGLPRPANDTVTGLLDLLQADDRSAAALLVTAAVVGPSPLLDLLAPASSRLGGRRIGREALLVAPRRLPALRRAARRRGLSLGGNADPAAYPRDLDPTVFAAARFVRDLSHALGFPADLRPAALDHLPPLADPSAAHQADALVRAWTAAIDTWRDPLAEVQPEPVESPSPSLHPPSDVRRLLDQALAERRPLRLRYQGAARPVVTTRVVEPSALEAFHGRACLRAYCRWRGAERLFRLDRIITAEVLDERFDGDDPAEPGSGPAV